MDGIAGLPGTNAEREVRGRYRCGTATMLSSAGKGQGKAPREGATGNRPHGDAPPAQGVALAGGARSVALLGAAGVIPGREEPLRISPSSLTISCKLPASNLSMWRACADHSDGRPPGPLAR